MSHLLKRDICRSAVCFTTLFSPPFSRLPSALLLAMEILQMPMAGRAHIALLVAAAVLLGMVAMVNSVQEVIRLQDTLVFDNQTPYGVVIDSVFVPRWGVGVVSCKDFSRVYFTVWTSTDELYTHMNLTDVTLSIALKVQAGGDVAYITIWDNSNGVPICGWAFNSPASLPEPLPQSSTLASDSIWDSLGASLFSPCPNVPAPVQ